MSFNPFAFLFSILGFGWNILYHILYPVHQRVQQRKQLATIPPIPPIPSTSAIPVTVDLSPSEVEILAVSEAIPHHLPDWGENTPAIAQTEGMQPETIPAGDRHQTVIALLDEAYAIGHTTYPALIAYVEQHSGTGCSRRVIAAWKRSRKLIEGAA